MPDTNCQLCSQSPAPVTFDVPSSPTPHSLVICETCNSDIETVSNTDHWQCLTTNMWSEEAAVQVTAYRILKRLSSHSWAQDALDMLYLEDETRAWAEAGVTEAPAEPTRDSNGTILQAGDTVTLIKDLPVKGAGFTAKRGTAVHKISLVQDNPAHIEGRVEGQRIVILTAFVKRR